MIDLGVDLCGVRLPSPVLLASGTCGYGLEFLEGIADFDAARLGGFVTKGITRRPWRGNATPRIVETASGMLNAIGLENVGVDAFIEEKLPALAPFGVPIIANVSGETIEDYAEITRKLNAVPDERLAGIEINISCPNVEHGSMEFGVNPEMTREVVKAVRAEISEGSRKFIMPKLSPNVTDIGAIAVAAAQGGADAVSVINTCSGMAVDLDNKRAAIANVFGGLSGPAIKPIALACTLKTRRALNAAGYGSMPIVGLGGIWNARDALEFIVTGATAVQIGTLNYHNPRAFEAIVDGIREWLLKEYEKSGNPEDLRLSHHVGTLQAERRPHLGRG